MAGAKEAMGVCRCVIVIGEKPHTVRRAEGPEGVRVYRMTSRSGECSVAQGPGGTACTCDEQEDRRRRPGERCGHIRAMEAVGIFDEEDEDEEGWPELASREARRAQAERIGRDLDELQERYEPEGARR